jgi:small subunit ribosomal protein S8
MTDPIADMLTRLRNAVIAKHARVDVPASKLKVEIAKILEDEGYIQGFKMVEEKSPEAAKAAAPRQVIRIVLKYGPNAGCTSAAPRCRRFWAGSARAF